MDLIYRIERYPAVTEEEYIDLLERSGLAPRRPVDQPQTIRKMLEHASLLITARTDTERLLVGVSRALTDFSFCTYLSDLAVDRNYQNRGIGRTLIQKTRESAGIQTKLILIAAPNAHGYYPKIGMQPHDSCWIIPPEEPVLDNLTQDPH